MDLPRLYLVTDASAAAPRDPIDVIAAALSGIPPGSALVQLRAKQLTTRALLEAAQRLVAVAGARGCPVLINDRLDVALAVGASGVHLPETGLDLATARALAPPGFLVGASTHSADAARASGADITLLGPIWPTLGKPRSLGPQELTGCECFAIGGIQTPEQAAAARAHGAAGVAVIRAVMAAADPASAAAALHEAVC